MKELFLEDLSGFSQEEVKAHIVSSYEATPAELEGKRIVIAYESVGSWRCDSSSWFLVEDTETGKLYETHGSHCSCYGFEGQWDLEETSLGYLTSDKFYFHTGGYDGSASANEHAVKEFLKGMCQ